MKSSIIDKNGSSMNIIIFIIQHHSRKSQRISIHWLMKYMKYIMSINYQSTIMSKYEVFRTGVNYPWFRMRCIVSCSRYVYTIHYIIHYIIHQTPHSTLCIIVNYLLWITNFEYWILYEVKFTYTVLRTSYTWMDGYCTLYEVHTYFISMYVFVRTSYIIVHR